MYAGKSTILHGLPCILFHGDRLGYPYTDGNWQRQGEGKKGVDLLSYKTVYSVIKKSSIVTKVVYYLSLHIRQQNCPYLQK